MTETDSFVTAVGDLLASWNLPHATGRTYGLLLLTDEPLSLDAIAAELRLSKGAVSTAVRQLVSWGLARTIPRPGSRRLVVEAAGGIESLLEASHARARTLIGTLRQGRELARTPATRERLDSVVGLFESYVAVGEDMLARHRESPP
ncbi:GbsR/MarR family transcriptional regulator [Nonomuraea cavernae]|uniref:GbsR/MarR family transcriptional regulator n=1 Tax=Nonomuraea cavernae TaxID=2045107 RepID=UPI0033C9F6BD